MERTTDHTGTWGAGRANRRLRSLALLSGVALLATAAPAGHGPQAAGATFLTSINVGPAKIAPAPPSQRPYMSKLEQIAAQQGEIVARAQIIITPSEQPGAEPAAAAAVEVAERRIETATHPAHAAPRPAPAVVRTPAPARTAPAASPAAAPNLFGSVAVAIGSTSMDGKWRSVSDVSVSASRASAVLGEMNGQGRRQQLTTVNRWVNRAIAFSDDYRSGAPDRWSNADESLSSGRGDCEDYAIAKMQILRAAGFSQDDLYLVLVKDLIRRQDHAVLVVHIDGEFLLLDSNTDLIIAADATPDYKPLMTFSGRRSWIHGYQSDRPALQLASTAVSPSAGE